MKDLLAANRYAQAFFETAKEKGQESSLLDELASFSAALKASPEIEKFLNNPAFDRASKKAVLGKIYGSQGNEAHKNLFRFLAVLMKKNRFTLIHEVAESFKRIVDEAKGIGQAEVLTAVPLEPKTEQELTAKLERLAGKKILIQKKVDPSIVGGVIVRLGNKVIDGSVGQKILFYKKELTKIRSV